MSDIFLCVCTKITLRTPFNRWHGISREVHRGRDPESWTTERTWPGPDYVKAAFVTMAPEGFHFAITETNTHLNVAPQHWVLSDNSPRQGEGAADNSLQPIINNPARQNLSLSFIHSNNRTVRISYNGTAEHSHNKKVTYPNVISLSKCTTWVNVSTPEIEMHVRHTL